MTTHFIGLKELRGQLTQVAAKAARYHRRYIVLRKNVPLFEIHPLAKQEPAHKSLQKSLQQAEKDVRAGRVYTQKEIETLLAL